MADNDMMTGFLAGQNDNNGNRNDGDMMGGGFIWIILIVLLFGGFGNRGGDANGVSGALTRADLCDGFNFNNIENGIRGIQNGICDSTYALNSSLMNGFHGVDNAICNLGYQTQQCCCETQRAIDGVRYDAAKNTCDIIQNAHNDADRIIGVLTQDKIESLRTELQSAQLQLSNAAQTNAIIDQIRPCPVPSYITCNPWGNTYGFGSGFPNGYGGGCGNGGCGCN